MIKEMLGAQELGIYSVVVRITESIAFIPLILSNSLFPKILELKKLDKNNFKNKIQMFYHGINYIMLFLVVCIFFFSRDIISLLYGSQFYQAIDILQIHIWSILFFSMGVASGKWFLAENLQRFRLYFNIIGALVNIGLNYLLIPILGIKGASVSTVFAQFLSSYFLACIFKTTYPVFKDLSFSWIKFSWMRNIFFFKTKVLKD